MADVLSPAPPTPDALDSATPIYSAPTRWRNLKLILARYLRSPEVWIPGIYLAVLVFVCYLGPYIFPLPNPDIGDLTNINASPLSPGHLLGTDNAGRDILSRLIYGGRVSLTVGFCAVAIGLLVGSTIGTISAYKGRWVDATVMRVLDVFLAFPALILALAIADILGASIRNVIIAISFFTIPAYARISRGETLRMRNREYVVSSRAMGTRTVRVLVGHIFPNVVPVLLTLAFLQVGTAMLTEAGLSFLGLGVPVPTPSWGNMIQLGQGYMQADPWLVVIPGLLLFITIVALNLVGNGVRDVLTSETS